MTKNLYERYKTEIVPSLIKDGGYTNVMQVPKITKVVLNVGVGRFVKEAGYIDTVEKVLTKITGQKAVRTKAKKSISNFKIREGMEIGVMVTLRGPRMYQFLEKLLRVTFPRVRDFHGISDKAFDRQGNYTIGFKEEERTIVFYESPHRILKTLSELSATLAEQPERKIVIARELTKMHEEIVTAKISEIEEVSKSLKVKGEFVIILAGK
jgi:large subunit ribosomal protein L5